jgi:uncharacterized protein YaaQ
MTLFIAVQDEDLEKVTGIIQDSGRSEPAAKVVEEGSPVAPMPVRPRLGSPVIFIWDIERSETY